MHWLLAKIGFQLGNPKFWSVCLSSCQSNSVTSNRTLAETHTSQVVGDSWVTEVDVLPDGRRQPKSLSAKALKDVLQQRMGHVALRSPRTRGETWETVTAGLDKMWKLFRRLLRLSSTEMGFGTTALGLVGDCTQHDQTRTFVGSTFLF